MKITKQELEKVIKEQIIRFCNENDYELNEITKETRLIGSDAIFDSMGLVTFLVELEEELEDNHSIVIEIADERAMSRFRSPFINIVTLAEFLMEKIDEK